VATEQDIPTQVQPVGEQAQVEPEFQIPGVGFGKGVREFVEERPDLPIPLLPKADISAIDFAVGKARRIPETAGPSAKSFFSGILDAIKSPVQTGKGVGDILEGAALALTPGEQKARGPLDPLIARATGQRPGTGRESEAEIRAKAFDPLVGLLKGRAARPIETLTEDPFGAAVDITALATLGAGTVAKLAPTGSKVAKLANQASKTAQLADPITAPIKAVRGGIDLGGKVLGVALELTTGTAGGTIKKSLRSTPEFRAALRGNMEGTDVVSMAKTALNEMKDQRAVQYRQVLDQIDQRIIIDIKPVRAKMEEVLKRFKIKRNADGTLNLKRFPESAAEKSKLKQVIKIIDEWGDDVGDFSPSGMDDLKQIVDSYFTPNARAQSIKSTIRNEIFDAIAKEVPEYKTMTAAYSKASKEIAELDKVLALGSKKTPETALKRLMSIAKRDEPFRVALVKLMEERTGVNIQDAVAGLSLSSFKPQGFIGTSTAAAAGFSVLAGLDPKLLVLLAASSPRLVGEFMNLLSLPARGLRKIDPQNVLGQVGRAATSVPATQTLFQTQRAQEAAEPQPDNILKRRLRDLTIAPF